MSVPSPEPRRLSTPSWFDLRLVLGVGLVLAAVLLGATVVSRASDTHASVTAARDLAAGTTLRAADLRVVQVQLPEDGRGRYLDEVKAAVGKTLTRPISQDELVPAAAVGTSPERTTLTVALASAAAPPLHTGQRIQLWLSTRACAFVVLLADVTVQSVRSGEGSAFGDSGVGQNVVISVAPALAARVVAAQSIDGANIRAGVLTGGSTRSAQSTSPSVGQAQSPGTSGATSGLPADLAACTGK